ncbi:hypothetical protein Q9189_004223 [Teloschistes chrysophthalmus]
MAKIRKSRVEEGLDVPPNLTKGGRVVPAEKDKKKGATNKRARLRKLSQDDDDAEDSEILDQTNESDDYDDGSGNGKRKAKRQGKSRSRAVTKKGRTSISKAGRKTRGSVAGSKATASDEDEDLQIEKRESSSEGSRASSEQNYAVGDSMWDLDSDQDTEMEIKRSHSATPAEESEHPSKVIVLNIGAAGFQKLGLPRGMGKSKPDAPEAKKGKEKSLTLSIEDEEMGTDHYTDGADEDLMPTLALANKGNNNTGDHVILGEQQTGFVIPESKGSMKNENLGGPNSSIPAGGITMQATMHHGLHDQVDPFTYLSGHSFPGDQAVSGMGPMNAGKDGYAVQDGSCGNQTFHGYFPEMAMPGQGPSASYAAFPGNQYDWSSQRANASSNGGYSYNQQVQAQRELDNTFGQFDFGDGNQFFGNPGEGVAQNDLAYTTGFTDVQMEPAPFDPVLPTRWSPEEFTADLDDLLNFE